MLFDGETWGGGVVGAEDVDIDDAWEGIVWGLVLLIWKEIVFEIDWLG